MKQRGSNGEAVMMWPYYHYYRSCCLYGIFRIQSPHLLNGKAVERYEVYPRRTRARPTNRILNSQILHSLLRRSTHPPLPLPVSLFFPFPLILPPPIALLDCKPTFIVTDLPIFTPLHLQSTREASPPTKPYPNSHSQPPLLANP